MQRTKPPFRADHVGSLLRSAALKDARAKREANQITAEQLKAVEDREIDAIIRKQEAVGLKSITDGEYRRAFWNYDFLGLLPGVEAYLGERKIAFQGKQPKPMMLRVTGKLETKDSIKRRIDEATKYVALDQLCLSPQCGFASTEEGNVLAEDEQWAKLRMIVDLAEEVWGR